MGRCVNARCDATASALSGILFRDGGKRASIEDLSEEVSIGENEQESGWASEEHRAETESESETSVIAESSV